MGGLEVNDGGVEEMVTNTGQKCGDAGVILGDLGSSLA